MGLGGAGRAADTVASGAPAQKQDDIACLRAFADDVFGRSRADDRAAFQALGDIAFMVDFGDQSGRQTDLVAVGGVAGSSCLGKLTLRQFSLQGIFHLRPRIAAAGVAHRLMDIDTSGQRVTDTAADTGRRAAEGFDLGRVVVGLILEHEEPVFLLAVDLRFDMDGTGVDLFRFIDLRAETALLQGLGTDRRQVHQRDRTFGIGTVDFLAQFLITVIGSFDFRVFDLDVFQNGREGRMTAVVRPVGIDDAQFGHRRITADLTAVGL